MTTAEAKARFRAAAEQCSVTKLVIGHLGPTVLGAAVLGLFSSHAKKMPSVVMNAIRIAVDLFTPKAPPAEANDEDMPGEGDEEAEELPPT